MKKHQQAVALIAALCLTALCTPKAAAQTTLFETTEDADYLYRIPSIVRLKNGSLLAISDRRIGHCAEDLGYGNSIDIVVRQSRDGGDWGPERTVLKSDPEAEGDAYGYGDCASVVDRETGEIMLITAAGRFGFFGSMPIQSVRATSGDGGRTWQTVNITSQVYKDNALARHIFFTSGRMIQSATVKVGTHYRVYAALDTRLQASNAVRGNGGSRVVYSDDFGQTWHYLGTMAATPAEAGDECKVEELPDGNILLSCRIASGRGRLFNIFSFSDVAKAEGSWGKPVASGQENFPGQTYGTSCNGEVLLVPAKGKDGRRAYVLLQSVPAHGSRNFVSLYWKPLLSEADYDAPSDFIEGWRKYPVSRTTSAYSTMTLDHRGNVAMLYEENIKQERMGYDIQFNAIPLKEITRGEYSFAASPKGGFRASAEP